VKIPEVACRDSMLIVASVRAGPDNATMKKKPRDQLKGTTRMSEKNAHLRVLFLCTGNSCRSQMAEGWARKLRGDLIEPFSAGVRADGMNPRTITVMAEAGIDISGQWSKALGETLGMEFDYVITLCGHAREACPVYPGHVKVIHHGFEDPATLVETIPDEERKLDVYRRIRDEIRDYVRTLPEALLTESEESENPVLRVTPPQGLQKTSSTVSDRD
jgi:arsenate reductase